MTMRLFDGNNLTAHTKYDYFFVLPFEKDFDPVVVTKFYQGYWHYSLVISLLYALLAKCGEKLMRQRKAAQLDGALSAWNGALAAFSWMGALRTGEEWSHAVRTYGFATTVCFSADPWGVAGFWSQLFSVSKLVELGDTAFIVLRKKPLSFLHLYHHVTVLVYTWHSGAEHTAAGRWFIWMNYSAHSLMYTYFTLKSLRVRVPKLASIAVTSLQIVQMAIAVVVTCTVYSAKQQNRTCQQSYENLYLCFFIYSTYFILFAKFFVDAYIVQSNRSDSEKAKVE